MLAILYLSTGRACAQLYFTWWNMSKSEGCVKRAKVLGILKEKIMRMVMVPGRRIEVGRRMSEQYAVISGIAAVGDGRRLTGGSWHVDYLMYSNMEK